MNKRKRLMYCIGIIVLCITGCSSKKQKNVDTYALAERLATEIAYEDDLEVIDLEKIKIYFDIEEDVTGTVYMGSGKTTEEIAVFEAENDSIAIKQLEDIQKFLDEQKEAYIDYIPEEAKRVEDAILIRNGRYVILCVSGETDRATAIVEEAFK